MKHQIKVFHVAKWFDIWIITGIHSNGSASFF